ncbi:hypothetical protein [Halomonas ramblicola]|uniref:hypothetical protein n=1 Tax=Halomonas ramblicola TaxID=747349 RepID=UPI0025B5ACC9|nr:hypothetical protein [Halomonas ramblicola]MDN3523005.1 hypothetical protein [Halomonas ramblicola]
MKIREIEASLADARPGEYFIVDGNGGLSVEHVLRMLNLLPAGLDFVLEAPCATWRETLSLRRRTSVPILFDELATDDASIIWDRRYRPMPCAAFSTCATWPPKPPSTSMRRWSTAASWCRIDPGWGSRSLGRFSASRWPSIGKPSSSDDGPRLQYTEP